MNFFAQQERVRRRTKWLVLLFALGVLCVVLAIEVVVAGLLANTGDAEQFVIPDGYWLRAHLELLGWTAVAVVVLILGASLYKISTLSGGGSVVARSMGGTLISSDTRDPSHRRLHNVVEEIAIASGIPVPEIYVLEAEGAINAFAAGFTPGDAAIAVSQGALEQLDRAELQGVIAHEFSHVFNGDMRLNIRLMGVLFGLLVLGLAGRQVLRVGFYGRSKKDGAPILVIGLSLMVIGFVGLVFGRMIQAAVSRQREFLADASAVQFTRQPEGIAGALKKISAFGNGSALESTKTEEVGHMLFADGMGRQLFATHPPLEERIRAIDPSFKPGELHKLAAKMALHPQGSEEISGQAAVSGFAAASERGGSDPAPSPTSTTGAVIERHDSQLVQAVGNPSWDHVAFAVSVREQLPPVLAESAHSLKRSIDVVLALLLDHRPVVLQRQLEIIEQHMDARHKEWILVLIPELDRLDPVHRLLLIELAFPALKRRPKAALRIYLRVMEKLIRADNDIDVFEYALSRLVKIYLIESMNPSRSGGGRRIKSFNKVKAELATVFGVLARVGHDDEKQARRAFNAGMSILFPMATSTYEPVDNWVAGLDAALDRIDLLAPMYKEELIKGLLTTLSHDGKITLHEIEMLRAICASLHCPMPPRLDVRR